MIVLAGSRHFVSLMLIPLAACHGSDHGPRDAAVEEPASWIDCQAGGEAGVDREPPEPRSLDVEWSKLITSPALINDIAVDGSGNAILVGTFSRTFDLGGNQIVSSGFYDGFIAKLDPSGAVLWLRGIGSTGDDEIFGVAVDGTGSIRVAGYFAGPLSLGSQMLTTEWHDALAARYTPSGDVVWAAQSTSTGLPVGPVARDVAIDGAGNTYVTGIFNPRGSAPMVSFDGKSVPGKGVSSAFLVKYAPDGTVLWARGLHGNRFQEEALGIATDRAGHSTVVGYWENIDGSQHAFAVRVDPLGNVLWSYDVEDLVWGGRLNAVAVDDSGASYVAGYVSGVGTGSRFRMGCFGPVLLRAGVVLAKIDVSGAIAWARQAVRETEVSRFVPNGIALDGLGNVAVAGLFEGNVLLDSMRLCTLPKANADAFVLTMDPNGGATWTFLGQAPDDALASAVAADAEGNIIAGGTFKGSIQLGASKYTSRTPESYDSFLVRFRPAP